MSYAEAIQFLHGLQIFGANFSLETPRRLAALAGNPQNQLRFIHVAGTNGKGSTCAMLESIYRAAGLRVGLFTSPHLVSFRERIQVNRQLISQSDIARLVGEMRGACSAGVQPAGSAGIPARSSTTGGKDAALTRTQDACATPQPTFFEFVTVLALKYFAEQRCDLVIWETGLGGRLDATNIVTPLASVITNIALDHQQWLGDTLEKIAAEKAGIIKPGVPVVTAAEQPEVLRVIERMAQENKSPLVRVAANPESRIQNPESLPGQHQRQNTAVALATVEALQSQLPVTPAQIRTGLAQVSWPGRLQLIERGAQKFLLDGAHNVAGAEALRAALVGAPVSDPARPGLASKPAGPEAGAPITLILGVLGDKDWQPMCRLLAPLAARIVAVPVSSPRSAAAADLAAACRRANPAARVSAADSLAAALRETAEDKFVVIAGSLYLIGEALELLDADFASVSGERGLNDWSGVKLRG